MADPESDATPAAKAKPYRFSHAQVAQMVKIAHGIPAGENVEVEVRKAFADAPAEAVNAKLIELGIIDKPTKLELTEAETTRIASICTSLVTATENPDKRVLFARYAIKQLREVLPKREKDAVPA